MIGLLLVSCANYYFASSIAVYARLIHESAYAGMITASFYFGSVGMRLVNGLLVQKHGARLMMLLGAALCMVACFAHSLAGSVLLLLFLRVVHGAGYSIFSTAGGTAASYLVPPKRIAEGMGYFTIGNVLAMAIGPSVALAIVSRDTMGRFHVLFASAGAICLAAWVLVLFIGRDEADGKKPGGVSAGAGAGKPLPRAFLGFEKGVVLPSVISFMMSFAYSPAIVYLASYGLSKGWTNVGWAFTMYAVGLLSSRLFTGRMSDRHGPDSVMFPAYLCGAAALVFIAFCGAVWQLCAAMAMLGLCVGAYNPQINVFCISRCSEARRGTATAAFNGALDLGMALGSGINGLLMQRFGYRLSFLLSAGVCLGALVVYFFFLSGLAPMRKTSGPLKST